MTTGTSVEPSMFYWPREGCRFCSPPLSWQTRGLSLSAAEVLFLPSFSAACTNAGLPPTDSHGVLGTPLPCQVIARKRLHAWLLSILPHVPSKESCLSPVQVLFPVSRVATPPWAMAWPTELCQSRWSTSHLSHFSWLYLSVHNELPSPGFNHIS